MNASTNSSGILNGRFITPPHSAKQNARFVPAPGSFYLAPFALVPALHVLSPADRPRASHWFASHGQGPARMVEPSLIPSTFTERRLILSYNVCFGMLKSAAVA